MDEVYALMDKVEKLELQYEKKEDKPVKFPFPAHALELKKTKSDPITPKVSDDAQYNPNLSSGDEAEDEMGDFVMRAKEMGKKKKSTAKSSSGGGFIKGQTLKPIDEHYTIGYAPALPYNDLSNDSFLVKPRAYEPVI